MNHGLFMFILSALGAISVVGIVGSALYWQYKSEIDDYTVDCRTPFLPILNINVLNGNESMIILSSTTYGQFGVQTYGNGALSNDTFITINEGFTPHVNKVTGFVGGAVTTNNNNAILVLNRDFSIKKLR